MEQKLFDCLSGGDSAKGVKLCLGLTDGDFWTRTAGVQTLYKGQCIDDIDFENIEAVSDVNQKFEVQGGQPLSRLFFVVRRVNGCGNEEKTINACLRIDFDEQGNVIQNGCNKIINVTAKQVEGDKVRLSWFYHCLNEARAAERFLIYSNNGNGTIDFEHPIGSIDYNGKRFYQFVTPSLDKEHYRFCIRAESGENSGNQFNGDIKIWLKRQSPEEIGIIVCQIV
ncbi:MAG: hypothetical protein ABFD79_05955 [Phycisphaerales bacterium]